MKNLEKLFSPKSIAIVGASDKKGKVGRVVAENILKLGYKGKTYLVNPSHTTLLNKKCYPSIEAIGENIDLAIVIVPAQFVGTVISGGMKKCKNYVVISAGFSELGKDGRMREAELLKFAEKNNLTVLGPNCLGFIAPGMKLNASFAGGLPKNGNIAFVSQSGALAVALMDIAPKENLGFSNIISIGNKMQIDESALLEYLGKDKNTKVIGMYLEGIKDGRKFLEVASKISKIKPIIVLKAGKTERAQKAISSHTGALAGSDAIMDALFQKAGVIRAETLPEFFNLIKLMSFSEPPKNNQMAVVTNAGGVGVLTTDAFQRKNIQLLEFSPSTKKILKSILPEESSVENPVDLLGDAREDRYRDVLGALAKEKMGAYIAVLTPQDQTPVDEIAEEIIAFKKKTKNIMAAVFVGGERVEKARKKMEENSVSCFSYPEEAVKALDAYLRWNSNKKQKNISGKIKNSPERAKKAKNIIQKARREGRSALYFDEAKKVMALYGISSVPAFDLAIAKADKLLYPLVVKVDSDKVLHKTEKKGVLLGIKNKQELESALKTMRKNFPDGRIIAQPMQKGNQEIILGLKRDATVGAVTVFGFGGIYAEIFKKVDFLIDPKSEQEAEKVLLESQIGFLFRETRGEIVCDAKVFSKILLGMAELAREIGEISELDINPLFLYNKNKAPLAADIKIII